MIRGAAAAAGQRHSREQSQGAPGASDAADAHAILEAERTAIGALARAKQEQRWATAEDVADCLDAYRAGDLLDALFDTIAMGDKVLKELDRRAAPGAAKPVGAESMPAPLRREAVSGTVARGQLLLRAAHAVLTDRKWSVARIMAEVGIGDARGAGWSLHWPPRPQRVARGPRDARRSRLCSESGAFAKSAPARRMGFVCVT